jgi:hypothetical protein
MLKTPDEVKADTTLPSVPQHASPALEAATRLAWLYLCTAGFALY